MRSDMQRRHFFQSSAAAALAAAAPSRGQAATPRPSKLKLGTQHGDSDEILRVMAAFGVNTICGKLPSAKFDENWTTESLLRKKEHIAT